MEKSRYRLGRLAAMAAAALLLSIAASPPVLARAGDPSLPCPAFSRDASGGWTVRAPVMLSLGGMLYSPMVGTIFAAGSMRNGIEMSDVLDRECGNR
jgi:hypothetical protein